MALQLLANRRALRSPNLVRRLSSSAASGDDNNRSRPSLNSYLKEVKSSLTYQTEQQSRPQSPSFQRLRRFPVSDSPPPPVQATTIDAIRKNLSLYRDRSSSSSTATSQSESEKSSPYAEIRKNMTMLQRRSSFASPAPALNFGSPPLPGTRTAMRNTEDLPQSVFGKELKARSTAMSERSQRTFGFQELGDKLRKLRPAKKENEGDWFSLEELSGRLNRVLEAEEEEERNSPPPQIFGAGSQAGTFQYMKNVMDQLANPEPEKQSNSGVIEALTMTNTPTYLELAPKDHLLETYNHPDNMSAAEKMKIQLAKVRDEFKMSESDCGSTRVQVALLTTKIKYLSSTLHKKDVHSRKGLVEMVDKRKRLLKYLRRTDWPSYCFVLDKLGLRDFNKFKR